MRKFLVFLVCSIFIMTIPAAADNQTIDSKSAKRLNLEPAVWQVLEKLTQNEKANAIIGIECDAKAEALANTIEEKWNGGNYEEATELFKNSPELAKSAIGVQWKNPLITSKMRWNGDVQIGTRDSVKIVCLDVDNSTGNLFAALKYLTGTSSNWSVNISTDTGKTWAETYYWYNVTGVIDAVVYGGYYYVGYTETTGNQARARRFNLTDGASDATYDGNGWITVIDEGDTLREIALACDVDSADHRIVYWAIRNDDSLRLYWSDDDGTPWGEASPSIGNADRGLDAAWNGKTTEDLYAWASYIGTDDSLYAVARFPWTSFGPLDYVGDASYAKTSIAAYMDTIMITFPRYDGSNYDFRYRVSYNMGDSWAFGTLADSSAQNMGLMNDITGRNGDGFGVVYQNQGEKAAGFYRHRGYPIMPSWSEQVPFTDSVARFNIKPSIERIASGIYGIVYANYPHEIALFDRSDWISGIEEKETATSNGKIECGLDQNIITETALLSYTLPEQAKVDVSLVNILGQKIATLDSGEKSVGTHTVSVSAENLAQGIYYIVIETEDGLKGVAKATVLK